MKKLLLAILILSCIRAGAAEPSGPVSREGSPADACTRSFKVYVLTEAGLIGFGISVTADTCQEANSGLLEAIKAFWKAI